MQIGKKTHDAEPGYRQWMARYGDTALYIPTRVADELAAEAKYQSQLEFAAERAEEEERLRERKQSQNKRGAVPEPVKVGKHKPEAEEVLRHRVLVDVAMLRERVDALKQGTVMGDKESAKREMKAIESALARGPDRSIVRPLDWRPLLDGLAEELPSFREPLKLISQAFAVSEQGGRPPVITPMLLLGPPGIGKSHFAARLSEVLRCGHAWLSFDQRSAGTTLRGSDAHWWNARHGILFQLLGLGGTANPVVVIDELDKAARPWGSNNGVDMLAQLHAVLESETARRVEDISLRIEIDASQVMYVATANELRGIEAPLLSRFEVFQIRLPKPEERHRAARQIVFSVFKRLGFEQRVVVSEGVYLLLVDYSPRVIRRAAERALAICVSDDRSRITADDVEQALGIVSPEPVAPTRAGSPGGTFH